MGRIEFNKRISLIVAATLVAGNLAFADTSKNCITDLKLNNDGNNVRVNIYTDKPYTDSVVVSKKEGNKYVILVPETVSGVKSMPKITGSANVNVSMQTVSAGKGYTKITLTSDKAINVVPKTITSSKPVTSSVQQPKQQTQQAVKPTQKPVQPVKPVQKVAQTAKTTQKPAQATKPVQKTTQAVKPVQKATQAVKPAQKPVQPVAKPVTKPVQKVKDPAISIKEEVVPKNKPFEILEHEVKTDKVSDIKEVKPDALLEQTIKDNDEIIKQRKLKKYKGKNKLNSFADNKFSAKECIKLILDELQTISLWKLLMLASAITFPMIVIMIILGLDKRVNKKIGSIRREDDVETMERALRENVEAVRAQKAIQQSTAQETQSFNSFDEMLDKVEDTPTMDEAYNEEEQPVNLSYSEALEEVVDDSDFEIEETLIPEVEEEILEEEIEEDVSLEGFENSVSLDEFVEESAVPEYTLSSFDDFSEDEPVNEVVPFNPDGVLAEFSNVSDKEFFDELVLRSFSETDVEKLPENTPADEVFDVMTEDNTGIMLSDFEHNNFEQEQSPDVASVGVDTTAEDEVTMLNEAKIDDNVGLYLVNYDNFSSLVGHIADDYFVIKKFNDIEKGNIIIKQTEKLDSSTRYLVRVGRNKMVVEVGEKTMSRLIDL